MFKNNDMIQPNEFTFRFDLSDFNSKRELINSVRITRKLYTNPDLISKLNTGSDSNELEDYKINYMFFADIKGESRQIVFQFEVTDNSNKLDIEKLVSKIYSQSKDKDFIESIEGDGYEISIKDEMKLLIYST